jgi:hypothetical protein
MENALIVWNYSISECCKVCIRKTGKLHIQFVLVTLSGALFV